MLKAVPLTLALCLPCAAGAADLLEVYELALEHDTRLRAARYARDAVRENVPIARAALLPQLNGGAAYGIQHTEITDDEELGGDDSRRDTTHPYDYGLDLSQVVLDLGDFLRWRQAGDEVAAAEADYRAEEQALLFRVANAYFDVLAAQDDLGFARAESEAVARQQEQAQGRFRAGIAAYTDVQEAQAQYDLTRAEIVAAERRLQFAHQALAEIVGRTGLTLVALQDEIPLPSPEPSDPDRWVEASLESNLELLSARIRTEIAERDVSLSRTEHLPSLRLDASQRFGRSAGFNQGDFDTRAIVLSLDVPIFHGLETRALVRQSANVYEQRRAELEGARRRVERVARDAFLGVTSGAAQVRALRQAVASNRTAVAASEAGLRVGTRTIVDLLTTQRVLYAAERDYARTRYGYLLSVLRLKQAAGRLRPADLAEIDGLLERSDER